jgi:hypothetical protein
MLRVMDVLIRKLPLALREGEEACDAFCMPCKDPLPNLCP